jgi:Rv0078B-related antitoxin
VALRNLPSGPVWECGAARRAWPCVLEVGLPAAAYNGVMAAAEVERFRVVFDLCDAGVRMYRQRMRRENPLASDEEVEAWVQAWLRRPSGEVGDRLRFRARG